MAQLVKKSKIKGTNYKTQFQPFFRGKTNRLKKWRNRFLAFRFNEAESFEDDLFKIRLRPSSTRCTSSFLQNLTYSKFDHGFLRRYVQNRSCNTLHKDFSSIRFASLSFLNFIQSTFDFINEMYKFLLAKLYLFQARLRLFRQVQVYCRDSSKLTVSTFNQSESSKPV